MILYIMHIIMRSCQGSLNYPFIWGSNKQQTYGKFSGFLLHGALFGLVIFHDPCRYTSTVYAEICGLFFLASRCLATQVDDHEQTCSTKKHEHGTPKKMQVEDVLFKKYKPMFLFMINDFRFGDIVGFWTDWRCTLPEINIATEKSCLLKGFSHLPNLHFWGSKCWFFKGFVSTRSSSRCWYTGMGLGPPISWSAPVDDQGPTLGNALILATSWVPLNIRYPMLGEILGEPFCLPIFRYLLIFRY